jgi:hypothetical protein
MSDSIERIFHQIMTIVEWFILLGGVIICVRYRRLSRSVRVISFGLTGLIILGVIDQVLVKLLNRQGFDHANEVRFGLLAVRAIYVVAWSTIVAGLGLTFRDLNNELRQLMEMARRDRQQQGGSISG